ADGEPGEPPAGLTVRAHRDRRAPHHRGHPGRGVGAPRGHRATAHPGARPSGASRGAVGAMTPDPVLDELNGLDRAGFAARLGSVAEGSPWVAEAAWTERPFADRAALAAAFGRAIEEAPCERQLALLRAHPELADRAAIAGRRGADSAREQASAGLGALSPEEHARLTGLAAAYRERFGFPFVMA